MSKDSLRDALHWALLKEHAHRHTKNIYIAQYMVEGVVMEGIAVANFLDRTIVAPKNSYKAGYIIMLKHLITTAARTSWNRQT